MCIIIDTNVLSSVLNLQSSDHEEFQPVFAWIAYGKGKMVFGGTTYIAELTRVKTFNKLLTEWQRNRKLVRIDDANVDNMEHLLSQNITGPQFNDHHIVAIVLVSGCKLICSNDTGLHALISTCYSTGARTLIKRLSPHSGSIRCPKIYKGRRHRALLSDRNIAKCCQPC